MQTRLHFPPAPLALLALALPMLFSACKPDETASYNPQIDGILYTPPAAPDLSILDDQRKIHNAPTPAPR